MCLWTQFSWNDMKNVFHFQMFTSQTLQLKQIVTVEVNKAFANELTKFLFAFTFLFLQCSVITNKWVTLSKTVWMCNNMQLDSLHSCCNYCIERSCQQLHTQAVFTVVGSLQVFLITLWHIKSLQQAFTFQVHRLLHLQEPHQWGLSDTHTWMPYHETSQQLVGVASSSMYHTLQT